MISGIIAPFWRVLRGFCCSHRRRKVHDYSVNHQSGSPFNGSPLHKGCSINTKIFNILHFRAENSVSSFTMTIMMKMEVEWLQKRSNFQAHRAQIHFDFKSLVFQSRKAALIFFTKKNQFSFCLSFKIKAKQSDTYLLSRSTFFLLFEMLILSILSRKSKWRVSIIIRKFEY